MGIGRTGRWVITVPGSPAGVPLIRRWARQVTAAAGPEHVADVELITSEYATNAAQHSASGEAGGTIRVEITVRPDRLRIDVHDDGLRIVPPEDWRAEDAENFGRGFDIVGALAAEWGDEVTADGHLAWAELCLRNERRRGSPSRPTSPPLPVTTPSDNGVVTVREGPRGR